MQPICNVNATNLQRKWRTGTERGRNGVNLNENQLSKTIQVAEIKDSCGK